MPVDVLALTWNDNGPPVMVAKILILIVLGFVLRFLLLRMINRVVRHATKEPSGNTRLLGSTAIADAAARARQPWRTERQAQRVAAIGSLSRSVVTATVVVITLFSVLNVVGVNLAPLLASASVLGVVIGFGAQNLVKDFLAGTAMLMEDQFGVGDVVDMEKATGTVEAVGLRVTRLRDATGMIWYVRNGEVLRLGNKSQGWSQIVLDVQIAYDEDVDRAQELIARVAEEVAAEPRFADKVVDVPAVAGIEQVTGSAVTFRVVGTCAANENVGIQRELRARIRAALDAAEIRLPAPVPPWGTGAGVPPAPVGPEGATGPRP